MDLPYTTVEECIKGGVAKELLRLGTEEVRHEKCADADCIVLSNIVWIWQSQVFKFRDGRLLMLPITLWFPLCPRHAPLQEEEVIDVTAEEVKGE
jgi:hypothetical protein